VQSADFNGRVSSEVESVRWVAANMKVVDPSPKDCPSAAAWGLLSQCRDSMVSESEFWKLTFPKLLPSRAQMEALELDKLPDVGRADEVIKELLQFRRDAIRRAKADKEPAETKPAMEE
jgi:hypothetical protein